MSSTSTAAKHRGAPARSASRPQGGSRKATTTRPQRVVRRTTVLTSLAAAATGVTIASGVLGGAGGAALATGSTMDLHQALAAAKPLPAEVQAKRSAPASRSDQRPTVDPAKAAAFTIGDGPAATHTEDLAQSDPRDIAKALLPQFGWSEDQFSCLDSLYLSESGWRVNATNASSGAYGIPQSLPASKMASAGSDWLTNPVTQLKWGLGYIASSYGSPCSAWGFKASHGWY